MSLQSGVTPVSYWVIFNLFIITNTYEYVFSAFQIIKKTWKLKKILVTKPTFASFLKFFWHVLIIVIQKVLFYTESPWDKPYIIYSIFVNIRSNVPKFLTRSSSKSLYWITLRQCLHNLLCHNCHCSVGSANYLHLTNVKSTIRG